MPTRRDLSHVPVPLFSFLALLLMGCSNGGGSHSSPPATPAFTSTPVLQAEEGMPYSYTLAATSTDGSAVSFTLTSGPMGATLSGNTISWTPTHTESRVADAFTVTATTAAGGSSTQTWSVTPTGTVNLTAVATYWGPSGSTNLIEFSFGLPPGKQLFFPQPDGTFVNYQGTVNADGSISFANVPSGFYWLETGPSSFYWTSTSDFDNGQNLVGNPLSTVTPPVTTTFDYSVSGLVPSPAGLFLTAKSDGVDLEAVPLIFATVGTSTNVSGTSTVPAFVDYTKIDTLYFLEYELVNSGGFLGSALGPEGQLSNLSLVNGGTNNLAITLNPSPTATVDLSIKGTAWASAMQGLGPGTAAPAFTNYAVVVQPYLTNGFVPVSPDAPGLGTFPLLQPGGIPVGIVGGLACATLGLPENPSGGVFGFPPITSDVDYGMLSYGDPFPLEWPRLFEYCQASEVSLPRPNSTVTDTFTVVNRQTTTLPTGSVNPLLTSVQNPTLNGASLFQGVNLSTPSVNLSWEPPANGRPYGYYVKVFALDTLQPSGSAFYVQFAQFGTAKTNVQVPFLLRGNTYVFVISAEMDPNANIETSPKRTKVPNAESSVVSAPVVIAQ